MPGGGIETMDLAPELIDRLEEILRKLYQQFSSGLPFHGWHHVEFVRARASALAAKNGSNVRLVEAAALVHDLNYMVERNSSVHAGTDLRRQILLDLNVSSETIELIEGVVRQAETEFRDAGASLEAQALSDADTIFKALPITPVLLAHLYMEETGQTLRQLSQRINRDQVRLYDAGIYFYDSETEAEYMRWAETNLRLWQAIEESLGSPEVRNLVAILEEQATS